MSIETQQAMCDDIANSLRYCPDCRRTVVVSRDNAARSTVCTLCARVIGASYVDKSFRWAAFLDDDGGGGATDPFLAHDGNSTVATTTTTPYPASTGNVQSPEASDIHGAQGACLPRMRGAAGAARGGAAPKMRGAVLDRSLADAFQSIDDMAARLGLADAVRDRAREVLRKLDNTKAFPRGGKCRNRDALYAACLHVACRAVGTPRTFKELASVTGDNATAGIKDIGRLVKHIKVHFGEDADGGGQEAGEMMKMGAVVRAGDYLSRFGSLVGIGDQEVNAALEAAGRLEKNLDVRRNPDSIAAAIIYMAVQRSGAGKSVRDVSTATGVSEVTIREVYYKDLSPHAELLFG